MPPGTAAHTSGFFWKHVASTAPVVAAPVILGTPLCPDELPGWRFVVEVAFGAVLSNPSSSWSWVDVTSDVMQADSRIISITPFGRQDENSQTPAAGCKFTLDNRQNRYSQYNPLCVNWPNVRSNTPVRVRLSNNSGLTWWIFFQGEATVWQPAWDVTGNFAITNVQAKGRFQRLTQHSAPLRSAMERGILTQATGGGRTPLGYWPFEDGSASIQAANVVNSNNPAILSGTTTGMTWSAISDVPGSAPIAEIAAGTGISATIPTGTSGQWRIERVFSLPTTAPNADVALFSWGTKGGTGNSWRWIYKYDAVNPYIRLECYNNAGTELLGDAGILISSLPTPKPYGDSMFIVANVAQVGSTIHFANTIYGKTGSGTGTTKTVSSFTLGTLTYWAWLAISNNDKTAVGHVAAFDYAYYDPNIDLFSDWDAQYMSGHSGETPPSRMNRLSQEEGIEFVTLGQSAPGTVAQMGPQGVDSFSNLMRECETADDGFWYDGAGAGTHYQWPGQRYNQAAAITLDILANEVQDFPPLSDDYTIINRAKVDQKNGSSFTAEQITGPLGTGPSGIGDVDAQVSLNVNDPRFARYRSSWEAWKGAGTGGGFRYPVIPLNLRARPTVAAKWMARTDGVAGPVMPGARLDIVNISNWATQYQPGTLSLMIEGFQEVRIAKYKFEIDLICTQNRRYDVVRVGDTRLGRVQTAGSTIAADAPAGSSSISVATQVGSTPWTTTGPFPITVEMDGIAVTVSNITGSTSPQTFTVDPTTVTKPLLTGRTVKLWRSGVVRY